jgi:hypothetical protein
MFGVSALGTVCAVFITEDFWLIKTVEDLG